MKKYLPYILYLILATVVMLPFFSSGFLFLIDMTWTPNIQLADYLTNGISSHFPITFIFKALNLIVSLDVLQKALLLVILFISGSLMYWLAKRYMRSELAWTAGLFYMFNPFVYERFLAGQWIVLLGYAYFPLVLGLFLVFLKKPKSKNFYKFCIALVLYPIVSPHWFYIAIPFLILTGAVHLWREKKWSVLGIKIFWQRTIELVLAFLVVNSFWLFSFWRGDGTFSRITLNDFQAFKTLGDDQFGIYYNVLSLYGFWSTSKFLPKDLFSSWWIWTIFFAGLSLLGAWQILKQKKLIGLVLVIAFLPTLILAVGYGSDFSRWINDVLFYIMPGFKGFRDTEKLVGLLAFTYALFIPLGTKYFLELCGLEFKKRFLSLANLLAVSIVVGLVFLATFGIFDSFNQELKTYEYPAGWNVVEEKLATNPNAETMLFLPWHGYPSLDFAGYEKIANPARRFFSVPVVAGRSFDNRYIVETIQVEWNTYIDQLVVGDRNLDDQIDFLRNRDISHIVLAKVHDFEEYEFLGQSQMLIREYEDDDIVLYRIK